MSTAPQPSTDTTAREFIAGLKYRYHHYEHQAEAVETEIREILAGRRKGLLRLRNMCKHRDQSFEALQLYLATIIHRTKQGDTRLTQLLTEKFGRLNDHAHIPLNTDDDD